MRKRLFCMLLAVGMIGSSLTAYAAETGEAQAAVSPAAEESAEGEEKKEELADGGTVPETTPETDGESAAEPAESPEAALDELPEDAWDEGTADMSEEEPGEVPESSPAPEESALSAPISEEEEDELLTATTTYSGEKNVNSDMALDQGWVINGDLKIGSKGKLRIGNNKLEVNGNVECSGIIDMDMGSILVINGNFIHASGDLAMGGGRIDITGDYRLQNRDGAGEYSAGDGCLSMENASSRLNIDGSFIAQSRKAGNWSYHGTMTVKKDVIQLAAGGSGDYIHGGNDFKLIMAGDGPQLISLANEKSKLNYLQLDNRNIEADGYFNAVLDSENNCIKPVGGTLKVTDLKLGNHMLEVLGNVECTGTMDLGGTSGQLVVNGNYIQPSGSLTMDGGRVDITGDYRLQGRDGTGNYSIGEGFLYMGRASSRLNIGGSFIAQSRKASNWSYHGTMTVKKDVIQLAAGGSNDRFNGANDFKLVMAGDGLQRISMASERSELGHLQLDNRDITADGYFNAILDSADSLIKPADGTLKVTGLKLNNHKLEVAGNVKASGNIDMGGTSGHLVIQGSHVQTAGCLNIGEGRMDVIGDLRLQMQDDGGNYDTGDGYLEMTDASGRLDIGGDFIMQSAKNTYLRRGTITLTGNMIQSSVNGAVGYVNGTLEEHKTILTNSGKQSILFDNKQSSVGTLQLTRDKSNYEFSFEPCWKKLIIWPFSDVTLSEGNWRYDSVKFVYDNNVMNGISGTTRFDPDEPLTRAMFATVLYRMAGEPPVQFRNIFQDVSSGKYYSNAVIWAYEQGIVQGLDGGKRYGIDEYITREQIAKMLREYGRVQSYTMNESVDLNSFPDRADVSGWAVSYIQWAVGSGMVTGKNVGGTYYLDPKGNATRVECAAMLTRFMKRYAS